ncbi:MAG: response regulator transcription factor [Lachnospiraceae bacterium]|jgi:DNA-binding response OmpR family regulator|nr:response regulator transcription factor [Lachnospiraceae bacterium]
MYKILIVEDDTVIAAEMSKHLFRWGYEVEMVTEFMDVYSHFGRFVPHLVLMDINLPFFNGFYWCSEIRRDSQVPILFLSSAGDNMNIVMAINMGGDDFVTKPFELEVLSAKIQALLRRTYTFGSGEAGVVRTLTHREVVLNLEDASLVYQGSKAELTKNEFRIMQVLMEQHGRIVSREMLMKRLWDDELFVDDNTLTVNITRIRRKIEELGVVDLIRTQKGMGYVID